ncbi:MAG: acyl-CoA dehydrogenase family protein [Acidimicrobiales bacterium]
MSTSSMNRYGMTDEVRELRRRVKDFVDNEVIPLENRLDEGYDQGPGSAGEIEADKLMEELKGEAKRRGLWALGHPTEIGGGGLPFMSFVYLNELIGRCHYAQWAVGSVSMQDSVMLHLYGSAEQKERFLLPMVRGEIYPSVGLTEPEVAGSDPTQMRTSAILDGDEWVINGHKWFTSNASRAAYTTCFAITEPEADGHRKFSAIIVPTDTTGYNIVRAVPTMGHIGGQHCEVLYDNVRVPRDNLLGDRGEGFTIAQKRLGPGRIFHCMRWLGQAQRAFELMVDRANTRWAHGSYLSEKGEIQRWIAESAAEIQAARLMTLDAAATMDSGDEARVAIALIKFWGATMLHNVIDRAIQVHGALGVTSDTPLERMYREARYARIYDGPDEVHRMTVARRLSRNPASAPWAVD